MTRSKILDCFTVVFLHETQHVRKLDVCESQWIRKLNAEIDINNTISPIYRRFVYFFINVISFTVPCFNNPLKQHFPCNIIVFLAYMIS